MTILYQYHGYMTKIYSYQSFKKLLIVLYKISLFPKMRSRTFYLNVNKLSGPDSISHKMFKYVSNAVSKPFTILFNRSLAKNHFPEPWKLIMLSLCI